MNDNKEQNAEKEVIDIEPLVENQEPQKDPSLFQEIGLPLSAALLIDFLDVATLGRFGPPVAFIAGAIAGLVLCRARKVPKYLYTPIVFAAGFYCYLPKTQMLPLATVLTILSLFKKNKS